MEELKFHGVFKNWCSIIPQISSLVYMLIIIIFSLFLPNILFTIKAISRRELDLPVFLHLLVPKRKGPHIHIQPRETEYSMKST